MVGLADTFPCDRNAAPPPSVAGPRRWSSVASAPGRGTRDGRRCVTATYCCVCAVTLPS